ncbi:MAG: chemotaxis protein CheW [Deltaproteobacteria bacterium]
MDMSQYIEIFIEETKEHVQNLNQSLLQLEKNPSDMVILNEIFRVAHTLKGMAGTMGFTKMATLTHDMEDVLQSIRNGEISISTKLVDILFKCLDAIETYLNAIINSGSEGDFEAEEIVNTLKKIIKEKKIDFDTEPEIKKDEKKAEPKAGMGVTAEFLPDIYEQNVINKALEMGINAYKVTIVLDKGCVLKSARAFIVFQTLERYSEIIKSVPHVEDIEDEKFEQEFTVVVVTKENEQLLEKELYSISEVDTVIINNVPAAAIESSKTVQPEPKKVVKEPEVVIESVKKDVEDNFKEISDIDSIEKKAEQDDLIKRNMEMLNEYEADVIEKTPIVAKNAAAAANAKGVKTGKTVRVDIDRLDALMNLVSELIIIKTRLEGIDGIQRTQNYNDAVEYLERITTNLHDAVMKVRMVPIEIVFNRFPRMIRDLSRETGKEINLIMSGEETELDRTVIDEIGDPLIHLLRNSADHGIETTEKRKQLGKPSAGSIFLRSYQEGNNVAIEVEDDGAGINFEKTKKKIIEKGLLTKDELKALSKREVMDYLFKPSFSTADKVTDISGRGVGLDVVKTKIEALGGVIEIETEQDKGCKFIIRLPLTLAIIQALLVLIGEEKFAVPLSSIREIINIDLKDIKLVQKQEVIILREHVIPIIRLDQVLEVPKIENDSTQVTVVVVKKGEKLSGIVVDSLIGQQEIVIKSLGKLLVGTKCIAGATILGDGQVALIIDVNALA